MDKAFYELAGDLIVPSELTRGPWDKGSQHAGPPSALIGRTLEALPTPDGSAMRIARVVIEILRPVPIDPLRIEARVSRDGRRVGMLEASMFAGSEEVMRARAWRIREEDMGFGAETPTRPYPPGHGPAEGSEHPFFPTGSEVGYHTAVEYRFIDGAFLEPGPATVWMRSRVPLVAGEELTPLERVLIVADTGNGVSSVLDWRRFMFINVDLTVHLHRYPAGEWVLLEASTIAEPDGVGFTETLLSDEDGPLGRSAQALLIAPR